MAAFQIGEGFVILLAALRGLSGEVFEAGAIDGAGRWASFRYLTLPLLVPWLVLLTAATSSLGLGGRSRPPTS